MNLNGCGSSSDKPVDEDAHTTARRERKEHVDAVLRSPSDRRIVVAGPGTGKTYLLKRILEGKKKTLTLTFVNALVRDLSLELCGLSDVRTLHSFAHSVLKRVQPIKVFPKLAAVIKKDARILLGKTVDFDFLFHNRDDGNEKMAFYKKRKDYYGHYGHSDVVFALVTYFEKYPDKIPVFDQVVVDEFQDFNKLEVSLIGLLATKSPMLLVGDDDQALYQSLKSASSMHIRQRHTDPASGYTPFYLPYCSRCTRVIIEATNDIVTRATSAGHLSGRISKPFRYFDHTTKDKHSSENPHVIYSQVYESQIPWFIQTRIEEIAKEVRGDFTVLIISPTQRKRKEIVRLLRDKGFDKISSVERKGGNEASSLDGLKLLLEDKECNLGWRIAAEHVLTPGEFETLLRATDNEDPKPLSELIETTKRMNVSKMLTTLRAVRDGRSTKTQDRLADLFKQIGKDAYGMERDWLKGEIRPRALSIHEPGIRNIPITATTLQGSKGLQADYVFITHLDDQYFIRNRDKSNVSDQDICSFLVALTRAKRKVLLISSKVGSTPLFVEWISKDRIKRISGAESTS